MGNKVSPNVLRLGINKRWRSRWITQNKELTAKWLHEDYIIRKSLEQKLADALVSKIEIERNENAILIFIHTGRVGLVLGQNGSEIEKIVNFIQRKIKNRKVEIKIQVLEVKNMDTNSQLIAQSIAKQISNRASFRTVQKMAIRKALRAGALGIKTSASGRLGGVEMARTEGYREGSVPASRLRADIDFSKVEAKTTFGQIGVKVWVYKGDILEKNPNNIQEIGKKSFENNDKRSDRPRKRPPFSKNNNNGNNPNNRRDFTKREER